MDEEHLQLLAEEVRCALCLEIFLQPRVLACQHSFCTSCLQLMGKKTKVNYTIQITDLILSIIKADKSEYENKDIECPLCRHITSLKGKTVENLPVNLSLANIIAHLQTDDIKRIINPDIVDDRHALLQSFPPDGPGTDFSFLAVSPDSSPFPTPRDLNQVCFLNFQNKKIGKFTKKRKNIKK